MTDVMTRRALLQGALALVGPGAASAREADSAHRHPPSKGVYLSYYGVGDRVIRGRVLGLLDRTELNTVVIDVKGDRGLIPYESQVPLARSAGAMGRVRVPGFDDLLAGIRRIGDVLDR